MSKKLLKKKQHQLLVEKEQKFFLIKQNKQLMKSAQKCQKEVNIIKIQENNLKNSQKTLMEIEKSIQQKPDSYLKLIENLGITVESLVEAIDKGLPENVADIKVDDGLSHFLISKQEKCIYSHHKQYLKELIESSKHIWSALKLKVPLTEENRVKVIKHFLENLKNVNEKLYQNFSHKLTQSENYQQLQHIFLKEYTGSLYQDINSIPTTNDPVRLSAMGEYINVAIKAYQDGNVGQVYKGNKMLYRNFRLPKDLISLYKQDSYIYFTNMTSTSLADLEGFGQPDSNNYGIKLQISLLNLQEQIEEQSLHRTRNLLFKLLSQRTRGFATSLLIILNNKTPQHLPSKPSQPVDKKKLQEIINQSKNKMSEKSESLKQEKIKVISNFQQSAKEFIEQNHIQKLNIQDSQFIDKQIFPDQNIFQNSQQQSQQQTQQKSAQEQDLQLKQDTNNVDDDYDDEEEEKIDESVYQNDNQINFTNLNSQVQTKLLENAENFDDFMKKLVEVQTVNDNQIKQANCQVEDILKEFILVNIEDETSKKIIENDKKEKQNNVQILVEQISKKKNYLQSLNIQKNANFQNQEFLLLLMNKSYEQINQQALFNDKIPVCLQNKFLQRFALSSQDNFYYKVYFEPQNQTLSLQDLKKQLSKIFFEKYSDHHQGNYLELTCFQDQLENTNKKLNCFLFQTNKSMDEVVDLIKTLPVKVVQKVKQQKHKYIQLCNQFFDCKGNMNYLDQIYQSEQRGNLVYNFPNSCVRLGLKVLNQYDNGNNDWLSMNNSPGEWAAVYTWITDLKLCELNPNTKNENKYSQQYEFIPQNALQCSQSIENLQNYIQNPIVIGSQAFIIAYQCRAKTSEILLSSKHQHVSFLDRSKPDTIRPYGIIIKQLY
ncbi:hypothetical protein ABPG72_020403 [Tetrahymena utriculariae]